MTEENTDTDTGPGVLTFPPLLFVVAILVGYGLGWIVRFPPWKVPDGSVLGGILICVGVAVAIWAVIQFARAGTTPNAHRPDTAIVSSGPYRFSRNPIYLSMALVQIGVGVFLSNLWIVILVAPVLYTCQKGIIEREEGYLEAKFGEEYLSYKRTVGRWL